ncbi:MAG: DNA repair protein RadC [Alphaproteobacteria bacterium]|nr:DNA repair protein RadC [Alphaproteobacteria bacterium]MBU0793155.1 DNA repair protein RadC [Alphaproteobacteria bacterium]MBU0876878.1 DNA repair protein RadC [Alphaproteobacteria bacterium]MBU1770445.1 DNA repair protein RadC [Alphaproteobacteria bacterium]
MGEGRSRSKSEAAHDGVGHRARLRQRLAEGGPEALLDHELIEYLLALAIPRRDTKPLAKVLIAHFGSLGGVLSADWTALAQVDGMGETSIAALKAAQAAALRLLRNEVAARPVLSSWQALLDYLRADMAYLSVERVRVLHLNARNMLLRDDHMGDGSVDETAIYARQVARRALEYGSSSVILVHNHPSGLPEPSRQDILITRQIIEALKPLGVTVHDHLIIASEGHHSMRTMGLI